jgi:hypothetical protein
VVEVAFDDEDGMSHTLRVVPLLDAAGAIQGVVATMLGPGWPATGKA